MSALQSQVVLAIAEDPRIPVPREIAVSEQNGTVTLRGTVESYAQRSAALEDATALAGSARLVTNRLEVDLLGINGREDAEIRGRALQALIADDEVPATAVDVAVDSGRVTLSGTVEHEHESHAAFADVDQLAGVVGITNEITVVTRDRPLGGHLD